MKKKIIVLLMMLIVPTVIGKAASGYDDFYLGVLIPSTYVNRSDGNKEEIEYLRFVKRTSDNQFVYRVNMWEENELDNDLIYYDNNQPSYLDVSIEDYTKIQLYANMGYKYGTNHRDTIWYGVAQYSIWKTLEKDSDFKLMFGLNDEKANYLGQEIEDLNNMVNEKINKEIESKELKINVGEKVIINNLKDFPIYNIETTNKELEITNDSNNLYISANIPGYYEINLTKTNQELLGNTKVYIGEKQRYVLPSDQIPKYYKEKIMIEVIGTNNDIDEKELDEYSIFDKENNSQETVLSEDKTYFIIDDNLDKNNIQSTNKKIETTIETETIKQEKEIIDVPNTYSKKKSYVKYLPLTIIVYGMYLYKKRINEV